MGAAEVSGPAEILLGRISKCHRFPGTRARGDKGKAVGGVRAPSRDPGQPPPERRDESQEELGRRYLVVEVSRVVILLRPDDEGASRALRSLQGTRDGAGSQAPASGSAGTPAGPSPAPRHPAHGRAGSAPSYLLGGGGEGGVGALAAVVLVEAGGDDRGGPRAVQAVVGEDGVAVQGHLLGMTGR